MALPASLQEPIFNHDKLSAKHKESWNATRLEGKLILVYTAGITATSLNKLLVTPKTKTAAKPPKGSESPCGWTAIGCAHGDIKLMRWEQW